MATKKPAKKPMTPGRISKLASNPGTRAALQDKYLNPAQLAERQKNTRLNAPVAAGSSLTNRDVAHQANAAATVHFGGDPVQQAQQVGKDQNDWYAQYQAAANQLKTDLGANAQQATQQATNTTNAVGQLGAATAVGTGQVADDAQKASVIRQALSGGFGNLFAAQGQNSKDYGAKIADLVVPGQKLTAQNRAAGGVRDALAQKAAFLEKTKGDIVTGEETSAANAAKMDLAYKTLGLDASKAATSADQAAASTSETIRHNKATESNDANKPVTSYGPGGSAMNKYGYTYAEWTGMSDKQRTNARNGKGTKANNGTSWVTPGQQSKAQTGIGRAVSYAKTLKKDHYTRAQAADALTSTQSGQAVFDTVKDKKTGKTKQVRRLNPDGTQVTTGSWTAVDSAWASAALDMAYDGHLSKYTINKLHTAGVKVNALGYPTKGRTVRPPKLSPSQRAPGGT